MRVVVDTNIYVSATVFGGVPLQALEAVEDGHTLCYSDFILAELTRTLAQKFGWEKWRIMQVSGNLFANARKHNPASVPAISRDPNDNPILACAVTAKADCIVTGDDDLLDLKRYGKVNIMNPRTFLRFLTERD